MREKAGVIVHSYNVDIFDQNFYNFTSLIILAFEPLEKDSVIEPF